MDYFVSTAKLGILQYCHGLRNTPPQDTVVGCIVGEELQWYFLSYHYVIVYCFYDLVAVVIYHDNLVAMSLLSSSLPPS